MKAKQRHLYAILQGQQPILLQIMQTGSRLVEEFIGDLSSFYRSGIDGGTVLPPCILSAKRNLS